MQKRKWHSRKQEIMNDNNHTFTAETRGNSMILS